MDLFVLDNLGDKELLQKSDAKNKHKCAVLGENIEKEPLSFEEDEEEDEDENEDYYGLPPPSKDISHIIEEALEASKSKKKGKTQDDNEIFIDYMGLNKTGDKIKEKGSHYKFPELNKLTGKVKGNLAETNVNAHLEKSALKAIEQAKVVPKNSERKLSDLRRIERSKTKGTDWFNMPATEVTEEVKNDLTLLQMRSALDPKHFYKKNDLKVLPKYFQIGTVQHSPLDHYNERDTRRNKKHTIVDELMADAEFQSFTKRKYNEVMKKQEKTGYNKAVKKMNKNKKQKK